MSSPLDHLGAFAAGLAWDDLPAAVRRRAALALRDTLGTMAGGARTTAAGIAGQVAASGGDTPMWRAFTGAVQASALDLDDGHYRGGAIHPSSVVVPALLAAADPSTSRRELAVAQVAGYEIGLRAAHLLWPRHVLDDYHCTGTAATLGAAAAVARVRGADADTIARAIAIAWAHAPMSTFQLPMVKESIGWSAATAVAAVDLAAAGFMRMPPGVRSAMDDTFPPTPFHRPGAMDDPFVGGLGERWETTNTYFKPYACCRYTHTALRSMRELMDERAITGPDDVTSIEVFTPRASMNLTEQRPSSLEHSQYSFPFVLATMLCTGDAGGLDVVDDAIGDPARLAVAARIRVVHDPALDPTYPAHYATRIVVHTVGGAHERLRLIAPGDPEDPMSDEDLAAKFDSLTQSTALAGLGGDLLRDLDSALPGAVYAGRHASGPEPTFSRA